MRVRGVDFYDEVEALEFLVDCFAISMKEKLIKKQSEGWGGWLSDEFTEEEIVIRIEAQFEQRPIPEIDPVDIANLAAFLWNKR